MKRFRSALLLGACGIIPASEASAASCAAAWSASTVYTAGQQASENGVLYQANWWTEGNDPATSSGPSGSGQPWSVAGSCSACTSVPPVPQGLAASGTTSNSTKLAWSTVTVPMCTVTGYTIYENGTAIGTSATAGFTATGLTPNTRDVFAVAAVDSVGSSAESGSVAVTTLPASTPTGSSGTIGFHLLLGAGSAMDSLTLDGGNYDDLILSNMIAGVMYGHLVSEGYPGIQFNKDYLYGSILGQLLQENIETGAYQAGSALIDPSPDQQAVMSTGQGGPYQINNYAIDLVSGGYAPAGHSLINYIAVQKNIGYSYASAGSQFSKPTPASFNNKYYGPLLPAFFHYNDMVALSAIGTGPDGWTTPWQPEYDQAVAHFDSLPNSFLDVILNVAYNQGYYGTLVPHYSTLGATATAATVASVNSYSSVWGSSDTYSQYPFQVHYYLDQLYDNPIPTTSPSVVATPTNHVIFTVAALETVFADVVQTLDYSNGTAAAQFFTAAQAQTAFTAALTQNNVAATATLDLANAANRASAFAVIDSALGNLETAVGMKFNATTLSQL